jgi:hypothetical protein
VVDTFCVSERLLRKFQVTRPHVGDGASTVPQDVETMPGFFALDASLFHRLVQNGFAHVILVEEGTVRAMKDEIGRAFELKLRKVRFKQAHKRFGQEQHPVAHFGLRGLQLPIPKCVTERVSHLASKLEKVLRSFDPGVSMVQLFFPLGLLFER